jgi:hypothetical protein
MIESRPMSPSEAAAAFLFAAEQHRLSTDRVRQSLLSLPFKPEKRPEEATMRHWAQGIRR